MPPAVTRRPRTPVAARVLLGLLALSAGLAGCSSAGSGSTPNAAGSATGVPGEAPKLGEGSSGGISITGTSIVRTDTKLSITARIHNGQSTADELAQVSSNVGPAQNLSPALKIPAGATVTVGAATAAVVLEQTGRLSPGGTVALSFQFSSAGTVEVFSSFRDAA